MNDDFFSKFRQLPRSEFNRSLYTKLAQNAKAGPLTGRHFAAKRTAFVLAALCLLLALGVAVSPAAARAVLDKIIAKITLKGTTVLVSQEPPLPIPSQEGENESYSEVWTPLSPNDISADYSFFARLPTWVPSGYTLQNRAALYFSSILETPPSSAVFEWKDKTGKTIQLQVAKGSCPNGQFYDPDGPLHDPRSDCTFATYISVGLESEPQVIAINDQPGISYTGIMGLADLSGSVRKWNPSRWKLTQDGTKGATMIWESQGRTFMLVIESATITKEEVIRLAESIP